MKQIKETILIVDDSEEILEFISEVLNDDYQIHTALNGNAAFEILDNQLISLVITDIMMPGIDGLQLCQIIKSNIEYCHIPIIMITAKNTYKSHIEGLEAGADAYVQKPFLPEFLRLQVANLLRNRLKVKDHFTSSPFASLDVVAYSKNDELFLKKLEDYIQKNIRSGDLDINRLADYMNMSRPTFYRKVKSLSSLSPKELVNITKLKKAAELIALDRYTLTEITRMVGFNSQSVFGKNFQKHFQLTPNAYLKKLKSID